MKSRSESLIRLKKFQVDEKRRQVAQIQMMISDFERMASELDQQIEIEQTKTGISDVSHFAYSTFAKARRLTAALKASSSAITKTLNNVTAAFIFRRAWRMVF